MQSILSGANRFLRIFRMASTPSILPTTSLPTVRQTLRATSLIWRSRWEACWPAGKGEILRQINTFSSKLRKGSRFPSKDGTTTCRWPIIKKNKNNSQKNTHTTPRSPQVPFKITEKKKSKTAPLPVLKSRFPNRPISKLFLPTQPYPNIQQKPKIIKAFCFLKNK